MRDALLALLKEAKAGGRRDRWILALAAGSLVVGVAALLVGVL
jgi:hypothetical protein